jgi:hypothetical protein
VLDATKVGTLPLFRLIEQPRYLLASKHVTRALEALHPVGIKLLPIACS